MTPMLALGFPVWRMAQARLPSYCPNGWAARLASSLSWRQTAGALQGFLVVAVVATYPLVLQPLRALPSGLGDPPLNTTILA
jgi:hypothetical protein